MTVRTLEPIRDPYRPALRADPFDLRAEVEDLLLRPTHDGLSLGLRSSHGVRWLTQRRLVEG